MTLSNRMHLPSNRSQGRTNQNVGLTQLMKANVFFLHFIQQFTQVLLSVIPD